MSVGGSAEGNSARVTPVGIPCAVCGELELEVGVCLNLVVGDFVNACGNLCELIGFLCRIPAYAVEEIAVADAYCGHAADFVVGVDNAGTANLDFAGVRVIGNGNVAVGLEAETDVVAGAGFAVPLDPLGVAAVELNDLELIDSAVDSLDGGNGDLVDTVCAEGHNVLVGSG